GEPRREEVALRVCKHCLDRLNYKGSAEYAARQKAFASFSLPEFFSHYSTCFQHMPKGLSDSMSVGYAADWSTISKRVREAAGYCCDECTVDLSGQRHL